MPFIKSSKSLFIAIFFALVALHFGTAQSGNTLVVEKGQTLELNTSLEVDSLVVKGQVKILDSKDISLRFSNLIIDGGAFMAGSSGVPFQHRLLLMITSKKGAIEVINGGSISLYGTFDSSNTANTVEYQDAPLSNSSLHNIILTSELEHSGYLSIAQGGATAVSGVWFDGLGTASHPAVTVENQAYANGFLKHCLFTSSNNTDLRLYKSNLTIEKNVLNSKNGTSIQSISGMDILTKFDNNTIYNTSDHGTYAIVLQGLAHTFEHNHIAVTSNTNGVGVFAIEEQQGLIQQTKLKVNHNHITNASENPKESIGLSVANFGSKQLVESKGNTIKGFGIGAILKEPNFFMSHYRFLHNTIGCIPGSAYLESSSFLGSPKVAGATRKALWIMDKFGKSSPKIKDIIIADHGVGFHFEGRVSDGNRFKGIQYKNTQPLSYSNLDHQSIIHDVDGSLLGQEKENSQEKVPMKALHDDHGQHSHHMLAAERKGKQGHILYPKASFFKNSTSLPALDLENLLYSKRENLGTLTIATGMGLTDPVHEHNGVFEGIVFQNSAGDSTILKGKNNQYTLDVIADEFYELKFSQTVLPFFDLGFEWEAPTGKSILLKVPYPHNHPVGLRSFGNLLPAVGSMHLLGKSKTSTFYWDEGNRIVYLKMVAQENFEEMVIYSNAVLTEINIDGKKVPIRIQSDAEKKKVVFEYILPNEKSHSKLEVLDYYGNVVELLYEGRLNKGTNTVSIDLKNYNFKNNVYRYALTVDNVVHRGPVHPY